MAIRISKPPEIVYAESFATFEIENFMDYKKGDEFDLPWVKIDNCDVQW
jgi:hypothetical protein